MNECTKKSQHTNLWCDFNLFAVTYNICISIDIWMSLLVDALFHYFCLFAYAMAFTISLVYVFLLCAHCRPLSLALDSSALCIYLSRGVKQCKKIWNRSNILETRDHEQWEQKKSHREWIARQRIKERVAVKKIKSEQEEQYREWDRAYYSQL